MVKSANVLQVLAVDPSFRNFAVTRLNFDMSTMLFEVVDMDLIETEKTKGKVVRQNSDDLRRGQEICKEFRKWTTGCSIMFSEIPSGAQSARAAFTLGLTTGILASATIPLIQVMPSETKMATVGTKTASKAEMIEWAMTKYPNAPWIMRKRAGALIPVAKNEHMADALAVAEAGIETDEFGRLLATLKAFA